MSWLDGALIGVALVLVVWWGCARGLRRDLLVGLSLIGLLLAAVTLAVEGPRWQLMPWQLITLLAALAVALSRLRPGRSGPRSRALGRLGLVAAAIAGGAALLFARVPVLPVPSGPHLVGSEVFRW